ncbi:MAG: hypothetical protein ACXABU_16280 [Candidatus Hodarchaeales archaeon]|jgi:DNA repair exonuclease SbcCD ATPase subunit
MPSQVDEILTLHSKLEKLSANHLQTKYDLTQELKELTQKEDSIKTEIDGLKDAVDRLQTEPKPKRKTEDITKLIITINDLENEIANNEFQNSELESELTLKKTEHGILVNKIKILQSEKEQLEDSSNQKKAERSRAEKTGDKVRSEREKLNKLRRQIETKEEIKKNLESATQTISLIEQVITTTSPIADSDENEVPQEVSKEIKDLIFDSKQIFDEAQTKFSSTDLTPYLLDADKAYKLGIKAFILLSDKLLDKIIDQPFIDQVFEIVNYGLILNTRHLNAVDAMLQKLEKGVEIAPLASFANEVRDYFSENLSLLGLTGNILDLE